MRHVSLLVLVILLGSCRSLTRSSIHIANQEAFGDLKNGIPSQDSLVISISGLDTLGYGKYAVRNGDEISTLKSGYWKEYYSNGIIRAEGEYRLGSYIQCCVSGPCTQYYHYKVGLWRYYSIEGGLKYELNYIPNTLHVSTNCQGGDNLTFGLVKNFSMLKYKYGLTLEDIFQLQKVEMEDQSIDRIIIMTPISGELIFSKLEVEKGRE